MRIGNVSNTSFGMKIPHTDALGELIHFYRTRGMRQSYINRRLSEIKAMLPDTFEFRVKEFSTDKSKSGAIAYDFIYKDRKDTKPFTHTLSGVISGDFIKRLKPEARKAKAEMIEIKGEKAVLGKGIC